MKPRLTCLLLGAGLLTACGGGGSQSGPVDCQLVNQNAYVYDQLRDTYLWAEFVADGANPASYNSPSALLQDLLLFSQLRYPGCRSLQRSDPSSQMHPAPRRIAQASKSLSACSVICE